MFKRKLLSILLVLCLFTSMISVCFTASSGVTTSNGIEYNESRLHTMDDTVADAYIPSAYDQWVDNSDNEGDSAGMSAPSLWWPEENQATSVGFTTDSDANYGQVLKYTGGSNGHFGFEDFDVKKDRKYYIYFDAKSETAGAQAVTLIGVNSISNSVSRIFFSGYESRDTGVKFYIDGKNVASNEFKYSTEWQRYGVVLDTSNEALLADITNVNSSSFWDKSIHFQLGVQNATVYFDNIQLIEIQSFPDAVADETNISADVSVRYPKTENENNGSYLSAGLRFRGSISDEIKSTADEIGFILTPSVYACENQDWYKISNGVNKNVRSAPCYIKDKMDVIYESKDGYTNYQVILTGLSTSDGKTSYVHRYSAAMYVKSGNTYSYYSLGETSFNEVCAKYYTLNLKSRHINSGAELVLNGVAQKSSLTVGEKLPALNSYLSDAPSRHKFLGWYDEDLNLHATVPDNVDKLYGMYEGHSTCTFDTGALYDANGKLTNSIVDDPFGGNGKVLELQLTSTRGFIPLAIDGISTKAFDFEKDHTYKVSFKYRYAENDSADAFCSLLVYGTSNVNNRTEITSDYYPQFGSDDLNNTGDWTEFVFTVTNTTDYPYLYMRFTGGSNGYTLYIDDLSISDMRTTYTDDTEIKLVNGGNVETTELAVGDTLPTPEKGYDPDNETYFEFNGWYDETLTTKYTEVVEGVTIYYAKFNNFTSLSFEIGGLYDPKNKYNSVPGGIPSWYRAPDPTGADNICMMANISSNGYNTHFSPSLIEGIDQGYTLTEGKKYILSFDYYLSAKDPKVIGENIIIRGKTQDTIGSSGNNTSDLANHNLETVNEWDNYQLYFQAEGVTDYPHLIIMCQSGYSTDDEKPVRISDYYLYIDNLKIFEYSDELTVNVHIGVDTDAENVTLNDNGEVTIHNDFVIGSEIPDPTNEYEGANFVGWYNELLNVPYKTIQGKDTTLYAKYDANVITFENGVMYDPNNKFTDNTRVKITTDPTNSKNSVMMINLNGSDANHHFAVCESSYSANGYKLTVGNTYTITYKYYAKNLNSNGVSLQFVGCAQDNIGLAGGKSSSYGNTTLSKEKEWTTVSVTFTYDGTNLTAETNPYLLIQLQDGSAGSGASDCTAIVYLDNIVIKESKPDKTYTKKKVEVNGKTLGATGITHNIVVPNSGFSYIAMMQLEELVTTIKNITNTSCDFNIVYEKDWTQANNQFNIFVGDLTDSVTNKIATSDFTDVNDYKISYGDGNISIGAGSPYALAMAISELNKTLDAQDSSTIKLSGTVTGKYSDNIDSYSSESYYRPTFLEDFNGNEINTDIWNIMEGESEEKESTLEGWMCTNAASQLRVEDGNLVIEGAYNENEKMFYGGHIRTHGNMDFRYGYLEVRCQLPHGAGIWPAAWMTSRTDVLGFYRSEIDVFESFCDARYATFNTHSWPTAAGKYRGHLKYALQNVKKDGVSYTGRIADSGKEAGFNDGFHTFGLLWTSNSLTYIVDGKVQLVYNYDDTHTMKSYNYNKEYTKITNNDYDAFNEKMSPIISMAVGSHEDYIPDLAGDYWSNSNEYIVDYVHIYQIDGQEIYFTSPEATE